jgi:hypothetical protein
MMAEMNQNLTGCRMPEELAFALNLPVDDFFILRVVGSRRTARMVRMDSVRMPAGKR